MNAALREVLAPSLRLLSTWLRVKRLRAIRASALRHMDVAKAKIEDEQENIAHFQKVEMYTRRELWKMGVES